jgi:hypothetical protein
MEIEKEKAGRHVIARVTVAKFYDNGDSGLLGFKPL